jgi:hypothetical protein
LEIACLRISGYISELRPRFLRGERGWEPAMSKQELQAILAAMEHVRRANTATPEAARQFLKDEGFLTPEGEIAQPYQPSSSNSAQS